MGLNDGTDYTIFGYIDYIEDNQTIINFKDESVAVNNYVDGKLVNITNLPIDYKLINQELASAFDISIDNVDADEIIKFSKMCLNNLECKASDFPIYFKNKDCYAY